MHKSTKKHSKSKKIFILNSSFLIFIVPLHPLSRRSLAGKERPVMPTSDRQNNFITTQALWLI